MTGRLLALVLATAALGSAGTNDAPEDVHIPILEARVACVPGFDPDDPAFRVTYSNTSPYNAISIAIPVSDAEKAAMVPHVYFDGVIPALRDADSAGWDIVPRHGEWIPPLSERTVEYRVSLAFQIPQAWRSFTVLPSSDRQLILYSFSFDRRGSLIERRLYASTPRDVMMQSIFRVARVRKALLEDTVWSNMVRRMPDLTNAPPAPEPGVPLAASSRSHRATNAATADQPTTPISSSGSELNVRRRSVLTGLLAIALGLLAVVAFGWGAVRWRKRGP